MVERIGWMIGFILGCQIITVVCKLLEIFIL